MKDAPGYCVVGAGLAGVFAARALVRAGASVLLVEKSTAVAAGASGNPAGIFKPILTPTATLPSRLSLHAFQRLRQILAELEASGFRPAHSQDGLLQLAKSGDEESRFREALKTRAWSPVLAEWWDAGVASARLGYPVRWGGAWFPKAGWIDPFDLCRQVIASLEKKDAARFSLRTGTSFQEVLSELPPETQLVFCHAEEARELEELRKIPSQIIRGQLSLLRVPAERQLPFTVSFHEYCIPVSSERAVVGATHDRGDSSVEVRRADHARVIDRMGAMVPAPWAGQTFLERPESMRAGLRFSAGDHLPVVGELTLTSQALGRRCHAVTALGSRGILLAPLLGEILAGTAQIETDLMRAIRPER